MSLVAAAVWLRVATSLVPHTAQGVLEMAGEARGVIEEIGTRPCRVTGVNVGVWRITNSLPKEIKVVPRREFWIVTDDEKWGGHRVFNSLNDAQEFLAECGLFGGDREIIRVAEAKGKVPPGNLKPAEEGGKNGNCS